MKSRKKTEPVPPSKAFDIAKLFGLDVKAELSTPAGRLPVTAMRIAGGGFKRVGTAKERRTPGGVKVLTLKIYYRDAT